MRPGGTGAVPLRLRPAGVGKGTYRAGGGPSRGREDVDRLGRSARPARSDARRGLKQWAHGEVRIVPIPPPPVRLLRKHLEEFGTAEDGRLSSSERGNAMFALRVNVIRRRGSALLRVGAQGLFSRCRAW